MSMHPHHKDSLDTWRDLFADLVLVDPIGPSVHAMGIHLLGLERFGEFREWVSSSFPTWRASPSAVLMVAHSLAFEGKAPEAATFVDRAEDIWSKLVRIKAIDTPLSDRISAKLSHCRTALEQVETQSSAQHVMDCLK